MERRKPSFQPDFKYRVAYVAFSDNIIVKNKIIDDMRIVDLDKFGRVVGIEFLNTDNPLIDEDLPISERRRKQIRKMFEEAKIKPNVNYS